MEIYGFNIVVALISLTTEISTYRTIIIIIIIIINHLYAWHLQLFTWNNPCFWGI